MCLCRGCWPRQSPHNGETPEGVSASVPETLVKGRLKVALQLAVKGHRMAPKDDGGAIVAGLAISGLRIGLGDGKKLANLAEAENGISFGLFAGLHVFDCLCVCRSAVVASLDMREHRPNHSSTHFREILSDKKDRHQTPTGHHTDRPQADPPPPDAQAAPTSDPISQPNNH